MKKQLFRISIGLFTLGVIFLTGCSKNEDTTAPSITLSGDQTMTVSLPATANGNSAYSEPGFSATDDEDGTITSSVTVSGTVDMNRKGSYTLTYTVADKAGNSTSVNRVVNVVNDAEVFGGNYNNSVDTGLVSPVSQFNAIVTVSDTVNNLVKINNFGAFGNTVNVWATINGTATGAAVSVASSQSLGVTAYISNVFSSECFVISGVSPTSFRIKFGWNDGANSDVSTSYYIR
ncbi:MAG: DUF5011 domain-containing protein [Bacteroidetes bacterium]|nr:DUF5011 domain-containing protein [Bacteroidota bacterium]MBL0139642.1 DUF5011 domain-containing protein [Bacteroidota bacterium]